LPPELYPHKSGLGLMEPVALIGHNVSILFNNRWRFHRVTYLESIPPFQCLNIGVVGAQTVSNQISGVNLELLTNNFGQFRWYPIDNAQVRVWSPNSDGRYVLNNILSQVDMNIRDRDPCLHLTELFVWEDNRPWFQAINLMDYALLQCRIIAQGFRFEVEDLDTSTIRAIQAGREACTRIVAQGKGIGSR